MLVFYIYSNINFLDRTIILK